MPSYIVVGVEAGSRQLIGTVDSPPQSGETIINGPLMLIEQRTGPQQVTIALVPLLQAYPVNTIRVNLSSIIEIDNDSDLAKRYRKEWDAIDTQQRATRAGIITATKMPDTTNGNVPRLVK